MDVIAKYFFLSGILEDDQWKTAHVIRSYHKTDVPFTKVLKAVEALKLDDYEDSIDEALNCSHACLIEASKGLVFANENYYISYLQGLLVINGIAHAPFSRISDMENKSQGKLF